MRSAFERSRRNIGGLELLVGVATAVLLLQLGGCPDMINVPGLNIGKGNNAPTAEAGPPKQVAVGDVVQLDGGGCSDSDGDALSYSWTQTAGPSVHLVNANQRVATLTPTEAGDYDFQLTVNDGRASDADTVRISVGDSADAGPDDNQAPASLHFDGNSFATLPLGSAQSLTTFTLEAWVKSENEGGTVASLGNGAVTIDLLPTTNVVRLQINGTPTTANASNLAATWRHIAVTYDGGTAATAVLYLDGVALTSAPVAGAIAADSLSIGQGFRGKLGDVRIWAEARSTPAIASSKDHRLAGTETNLLGYWPLAEGTGQVLNNRARPDADGALGSSTAPESSDPAWSTDGPPL